MAEHAEDGKTAPAPVNVVQPVEKLPHDELQTNRLRESAANDAGAQALQGLLDGGRLMFWLQDTPTHSGNFLPGMSGTTLTLTHVFTLARPLLAHVLST